jgi:hypothetical protein
MFVKRASRRRLVAIFGGLLPLMLAAPAVAEPSEAPQGLSELLGSMLEATGHQENHRSTTLCSLPWHGCHSPMKISTVANDKARQRGWTG